MKPLIWHIADRIDRRGPDECWPWTGRLSNCGYGRVEMSRGGKRQRMSATRALWQVVHGTIPEGYCICHHCDNPACMNMRHWFLGTQAENIADMHTKGRARRVRGEQHGRAKLTDDGVRQIRSLAREGLKWGEIAARLGVSRATARRAGVGISWQHV